MLSVRLLLAWFPYLLLTVAVAGTPLLQAQPADDADYEGKPILNISFSPAEQPLEASELHDILPLKINQPLRMADVRAAIDRLFATGRYADIQVEAEPYKEGVAVTFVTANAWFIGGVRARGRISSPPNAAQLENAADLDLGQPFTEAGVERGVENQKRLLEANGLYRAELDPVLDFETGRDYQQVNIRFNVSSGTRARFTTPMLTGDLKMDMDRLVRATRLRRWLIHTWKPVTQTRVRQALEGVRSLYQKEGRLESQVKLESLNYDPQTNQAVPTLEIDAGPRIELHTIGANVPDRKLRRYVPVFEEHAVDQDLLAEGARNLRDYFQTQGYFEADVEFKQQRTIDDKASIDYLVGLGRRHKVAAIEITGNHYFDRSTIRERMYLQPATFLEYPHGRYSENLLRRDVDAISNLYQSNGFRDVKVTSRTEDNYRDKPGEMAVFLDIQEGPQYLIGSLQVDGIEHLNQRDVLSRLTSLHGQPFSEFNVAVDRDTILAQYFSNGFPKATFEWSSKPGAEPNRIDLEYVVHEGQQQFVREVIYNGNTVTQNRLIDRTLTLNPGDPLSPTQITDIQRKLYDLGVFAKVDAAIQDPDGDTAEKYVIYQLEEARRYSTDVGFGAELGRIGGCETCLDAPAGATGFSPRVSVDVARNNLWGLGHSLSLRTRVSTLEQRALLNYSWPRFAVHDNLTVSFTGLWDDSRDIRTFNSRRQEGSAQLNQRFSKSLTLFYRLSYRRVSISDLKISRLPGAAADATGAGGHRVHHYGAGSARRSRGSAQGHVYDRECGAGRTFPGIAARFREVSGAQRELLPHREESGAGAQHRDRKYLGLPLQRRPGGRHSAGRAAVRRRRHLAPRFSGGPGGPARRFDRLSAGRHRAAFQPDRAAFSADRRQYRRRAVPRYGEHLSVLGRHFVPRQAAEPAGLRLHGACGRIRHPLPHPGRAGAGGPGVQHQSAVLFRIQRH